jgi:acyl-CoA thioester hydrolase
MGKDLQLSQFPLKTYDKIRYSDTDHQGHVNNAYFSTFLETGRVELLYKPELRILSDASSFVVASLQLNLLNELHWPGRVDTGTGILKIGNSSIKIFQQLFQDDVCTASAVTVIVQVDDSTGKSKPLSDEAKKILERWLLVG